MPNDYSVLLKAAALGDTEAAHAFLSAVLKESLIVPRRIQEVPIKELAQYPNDILDVLALRGEDRVIVPVFLTADSLTEWSSLPLQVRELNLAELIKILPSDWWIAINPGSEFNKELSPWELEQLRHGEAGIQAVLDESDPLPRKEVMLEAVRAEEFTPLKDSLSKFAAERKSIRSLWLLRSIEETSQGRAVPSLKLGVLITPPKDQPVKKSLEDTQSELTALAGRELIGAEDLQVICGVDPESLALSTFKGVAPFYSLKPSGLIPNLLKLLGK